jgi:hypothetical protein
VGQVLKRLGVEHIPSYSPQGRGRSERMNGTLQGRLVNELKLAGARSLEAAHRYIRGRYLATHNQAFSIPPRETESAFVPARDAPLDEIFCRETVRQVGKDNAINCGKVVLQISKQPGRKTCAGLSVVVRQHFDGTWSIHRGTQVFGRYAADGRPVEAAGPVEATPRSRPSERLPQGPWTPANGRRRPQLPQAPSPANL